MSCYPVFLCVLLLRHLSCFRCTLRVRTAPCQYKESLSFVPVAWCLLGASYTCCTVFSWCAGQVFDPTLPVDVDTSGMLAYKHDTGSNIQPLCILPSRIAETLPYKHPYGQTVGATARLGGKLHFLVVCRKY